MAPEYTGRGDPRLTIQLLWGGKPRGGRGRKPGLSVERIVAAGIALADREGLEAVSMRRVAQELGGGTMSLYRHVPGKGELLDLMFDRVVAESVDVPDLPDDAGWRARLEALAWQSWRVFLRHPWLLQISAARPPLGPGVLDSYHVLLEAVDGIGLDGAEMNATVTLVADFVAGAARRAIDSAQAAAHTGETDEAWWSARSSFWDEWFDPERYPIISRIYAEGGYEEEGEAAFAYGLARVLDGIQARVDFKRT
jgi:AcrR family transcriptional regulator